MNNSNIYFNPFITSYDSSNYFQAEIPVSSSRINGVANETINNLFSKNQQLKNRIIELKKLQKVLPLPVFFQIQTTNQIVQQPISQHQQNQSQDLITNQLAQLQFEFKQLQFQYQQNQSQIQITNQLAQLQEEFEQLQFQYQQNQSQDPITIQLAQLQEEFEQLQFQYQQNQSQILITNRLVQLQEEFEQLHPQQSY